MRVLVVHNRYQQPGGEDSVFAAETSLLRARGHDVVEYVEDNDRIDGMRPWTVAANTIWSRSSYRNLRDLIRVHRPDIAHFHNTFPLVSPSGYSACHDEGVAVVQTLHNYRLMCPNSYFFRDGHPCEDCLGRTPPWPSVLHACYRESRVQTTVVAAMLTAHRAKRTWSNRVDQYIALSEFARGRFVAAGLPSDRISIKPNFVEDPGVEEGNPRETFLFVGRLDSFKGIDVLLRAWEILDDAPELHVVGDGELADAVTAAAGSNARVRYLGRLPRAEAIAQVKQARALILPSVCYENFPMTIVEAFACGVPVIASHLGSMIEIIDHGRTGLFFPPGDSGELAMHVARIAASPELAREMGSQARREYELKYTADRNYEALLALYRRAQHVGATRMGKDEARAVPRA